MKTTLIVLLALLVAAVTPAVALAQGSGNAPQPASERRPYRGIFGGSATRNSPHSLVFAGSAFAAYDDNVLDGLTSGRQRDRRLQSSGTYGGANAGLQYGLAFSASRFSINANAAGFLRYYQYNGQSSLVPDYDNQASVNTRFALSRSTTLGLGHGLSYTRNYRFLSAPPAVVGDAPGAVDDDGFAVDQGSFGTDPDLDLFVLPALRNTSRVSLSQRLTRYSSITAGYGLQAVTFLGEETDGTDRRLRDYTTQSGWLGFQYGRPMTAHASLNLGYRIRVSDARLGTGEAPTMHSVRAGVDYSRALSFSRRTSVSFSTGSTMAVSDQLSDPESDSRMHFRVTGSAMLLHEMGRTWTARAAYYRGFVFREGFDQPFFTDGVWAGIGGLVTRRLSFSADGAWSLSALQRQGRTGQTSFSGSAQATYGLNKYLALFTRYVYYKYRFDADVPLDPRLPRALDRHGVRAGIAVSIPLF